MADGMWLDPNLSRHHPLFGHMDKSSPWQIRQGLTIQNPTRQQLDELAAEELSGKDRSSVYLIFKQFKPHA